MDRYLLVGPLGDFAQLYHQRRIDGGPAPLATLTLHLRQSSITILGFTYLFKSFTLHLDP